MHDNDKVAKPGGKGGEACKVLLHARTTIVLAKGLQSRGTSTTANPAVKLSPIQSIELSKWAMIKRHLKRGQRSVGAIGKLVAGIIQWNEQRTTGVHRRLPCLGNLARRLPPSQREGSTSEDSMGVSGQTSSTSDLGNRRYHRGCWNGGHR